MGLESIIQICNQFVYDALVHAKVKYSCADQMTVFLHTLRGHVDTDAFVHLEIERFKSYFPCISKLVALSFLCECRPVSANACIDVWPLDFMRRLWKNVLGKVSATNVLSQSLLSDVNAIVGLFVHTEFCTFALNLIEKDSASEEQ